MDNFAFLGLIRENEVIKKNYDKQHWKPDLLIDSVKHDIKYTTQCDEVVDGLEEMKDGISMFPEIYPAGTLWYISQAFTPYDITQRYLPQDQYVAIDHITMGILSSDRMTRDECILNLVKCLRSDDVILIRHLYYDDEIWDILFRIILTAQTRPRLAVIAKESPEETVFNKFYALGYMAECTTCNRNRKWYILSYQGGS